MGCRDCRCNKKSGNQVYGSAKIDPNFIQAMRDNPDLLRELPKLDECSICGGQALCIGPAVAGYDPHGESIILCGSCCSKYHVTGRCENVMHTLEVAARSATTKVNTSNTSSTQLVVPAYISGTLTPRQYLAGQALSCLQRRDAYTGNVRELSGSADEVAIRALAIADAILAG